MIADANRRASQAPDRQGYFNAIAQYAFEPGSLYQVYAAPMRITDIVLEPGEKILGQPASGDIVRWVLAAAKSMQGGVEQWHVYVKPTRPELETNLAINTDRRSYMLELHSYAETYMASVMWHYPVDELARLQTQAAESAAETRSTAPVVSLDALNFNYAVQVISGTPSWTPVQVFDDGRRTFIRFPETMLVREAPALFVLRDKETQLVNYRVRGSFYVVDRLLDSAELRVGQQEPGNRAHPADAHGAPVGGRHARSPAACLTAGDARRGPLTGHQNRPRRSTPEGWPGPRPHPEEGTRDRTGRGRARGGRLRPGSRPPATLPAAWRAQARARGPDHPSASDRSASDSRGLAHRPAPRGRPLARRAVAGRRSAPAAGRAVSGRRRRIRPRSRRASGTP